MHLITLGRYSLRQDVSAQRAFDADLLKGSINAHLGRWVKALKSLGYGALTVTAAHSRDDKNVFHGPLLFNQRGRLGFMDVHQPLSICRTPVRLDDP